MHDIVRGGSILHVPAVHDHGVLDLLGPGIVVHAHTINVRVGHQKQLVHHAVELVVVGDGDRGPLQFAEGSSVVNLVELDLKVLVLLVLHVVHDGDDDVPLRLAVLELKHALPTLVVLAVDGRFVQRPPLHIHFSVSAVLSKSNKNKT